MKMLKRQWVGEILYTTELSTNIDNSYSALLLQYLIRCILNYFLAYEKKTFKEFLKDKKLTPNLIHYVLYAISMSNNETLFQEGIKNTKRFLNSLGRFGKTPFLFSMYGSGDITQAFCR